MSAGDRNTLALAFFFASLDQDPQLAEHIVVIYDPITSLDEHRSLTTIHEMQRLCGRVRQIVLSHSSPFMCDLGRCRQGYPIRAADYPRWHGFDARHLGCSARLHHRARSHATRWYQNTSGHKRRSNAMSLLRLGRSWKPRCGAYPASFPPVMLLGPFINLCQQRQGTPQQDQTSLIRMSLTLLYITYIRNEYD